MKKKLIGIATVVGFGVFGLTCTTVVKQGYVGAVYDKLEKGIQDQTLSEGLHFKAPWQTISMFPVSVETVYMSADKREGSKENESITVGCKDGSLNADLTFSYRFKAENVPDIQRKYRGKDGDYIMNTVLRGQLRTWVSEVTKDYSTMEIHIESKDKVNSELTKYLNEKGEKYGVTFENVSLAETRPSKEVQKAIEKRQEIAQELEQQKLNLEKAEIAKDQATLEQEKALIIAEGERKANEAKAQGLDEKILKEKAIEKWDGKLPQVTDGNALVKLN